MVEACPMGTFGLLEAALASPGVRPADKEEGLRLFQHLLPAIVDGDVLLSWVQPLAILCTKYMPSSAASAATAPPGLAGESREELQGAVLDTITALMHRCRALGVSLQPVAGITPVLVQTTLTVAERQRSKALRRRALDALLAVLTAGTADMATAVFPGTASALTRIIASRDVSVGHTVRSRAIAALHRATLTVCADDRHAEALRRAEAAPPTLAALAEAARRPGPARTQSSPHNIVVAATASSPSPPEPSSDGKWLSDVRLHFTGVARALLEARVGWGAGGGAALRPAAALTALCADLLIHCRAVLRDCLPYVVELLLINLHLCQECVGPVPHPPPAAEEPEEEEAAAAEPPEASERWPTATNGVQEFGYALIRQQEATQAIAQCQDALELVRGDPVMCEAAEGRFRQLVVGLPSSSDFSIAPQQSLLLVAGYIEHVFGPAFPALFDRYRFTEQLATALQQVTQARLSGPGLRSYRCAGSCTAVLQWQHAHPASAWDRSYVECHGDDPVLAAVKRVAHAIAHWGDVRAFAAHLLGLLQDWDRWRGHHAVVFLLNHLLLAASASPALAAGDASYHLCQQALDAYLTEEFWDLEDLSRPKPKPPPPPPDTPLIVELPDHVAAPPRPDTTLLVAEHRLHLCCLLMEGVAAMAVGTFLGRDLPRLSQLFCLEVLYVLLEKAADPHQTVSATARCALEVVAEALGYGANAFLDRTGVMLVANSDYLVDAVLKRLRFPALYPSTPLVLATLLRATASADPGAPRHPNIAALLSSTLTVVLATLDQTQADRDAVHRHLRMLDGVVTVLAPAAARHTEELLDRQAAAAQRRAARLAAWQAADPPGEGAEGGPAPMAEIQAYFEGRAKERQAREQRKQLMLPEEDEEENANDPASEAEAEAPKSGDKDMLLTILAKVRHFCLATTPASSTLVFHIYQQALLPFVAVSPPLEAYEAALAAALRDPHRPVPRLGPHVRGDDPAVYPRLHTAWAPMVAVLLPSGHSTFDHIAKAMPPMDAPLGFLSSVPGPAGYRQRQRLPSPPLSPLVLAVVDHARWLLYHFRGFLEHRLRTELWPILRYHLHLSTDFSAPSYRAKGLKELPAAVTGSMAYRLQLAILKWALSFLAAYAPDDVQPPVDPGTGYAAARRREELQRFCASLTPAVRHFVTGAGHPPPLRDHAAAILASVDALFPPTPLQP